MASQHPGLFRPRTFGNDAADVSSRRSAADVSDLPTFTAPQSPAHSGKELTKNDKYCVSSLPALPAVLRAAQPELLNGYTDNHTQCALTVSNRAINVWPYNSTDDSPISFEFPLSDTSQDALRLAILTRPTPGTTLDPGLVIVNAMSGHVCFYESVQHAPALGLINSKLLETVINISAAAGEYITLAENVEPAGIAVATSWKRVVLVSLRDYNGAPRLSTLELTKPSASGLLARWFGGSIDAQLKDEIVSIKSGAVSNHGMTQDIVVQDATGTFKKFVHQVSTTGVPYINHGKSLSYRLSSYLENNIDGLIPGSVFDIKFLDLSPSPAAAHDLYHCLVSVSSSLHGVDEKRLSLITMNINASGVLVLGSHQLPDVPWESALSKPALFVPKAGKTAFVAVGNSIIMSDLKDPSAPTSADFQYYQPKWEDAINFKASLQVIGYGYEDSNDSQNPAIVFITQEYGVIRIERFPQASDELMSDDDPTDPSYLLKSHIQQAIYYQGQSPVDFDVGAGYSSDVVVEAVNTVVCEILDSSSPYLPPIFPSTRESFSVRSKLLQELIEFVKRNFQDNWYVVMPTIVEALEKIQVCLKLWEFTDAEGSEAAAIKASLRKVVSSRKYANPLQSEDILRAFFTHNVSEILEVFTELVESMIDSSVRLKTLVKILVATLFTVVTIEKKHISEVDEIANQKLWLFDSSLLLKAEEVYSRAYCSNNQEFQFMGSAEGRDDLIHFTETLYFLVTNAIQYMQDTSDDQLRGYLKWYQERNGQWIEAMVKRGLVKEALTVAENYHDFLSVAGILEKEREQTSPEYIQDKIDYYMDTYGYQFAAKLFEFYLANDKIQRLLVDCKPYETHLENYFERNARKSNKVSWIHYLLVENYKQASQVLISLSASGDVENQETREFNFSLAKLTAIAAKLEDPNTSESPLLEEMAIEAESNLVVVRIQNKLHHTICQFVEGKKELLTLDYFVDNFANPNLSKKQIGEEIGGFFPRFAESKAITKEQLIALLTSMRPFAHFSEVFADALKVAASISNDSVFQKECSEVWKKLLCTTDDWEKVTATGENSDEANKQAIRGTTIFNTLRAVKDSGEIKGVLQQVIRHAQGSEAVDGEWDSQVRALQLKHNLGSWVNTLEMEAR